MTQPDNFGFGEEAGMLKESARKFFAEYLPVDKLHRMVASDTNPERMSTSEWDRDIWQKMVELGWTSVAVPDSAGGIGMPVVAVAGLAEEAGRAAFPCPLLATLNVTYVLAACGGGGEAALAEIAEGKTASLAITNKQGSWDAADTDVLCTQGTLNGTAWFVQDARKVDRLLVSAQTSSGQALYWVATDAAGVTIAPDAIVDLTRDQAHVTFENVAAQEVSDDGLAALTKAMPAIWTLLAADIAGAATFSKAHDGGVCEYTATV
jgi:alkylation response protein AidB-like acyl-CoA dehydrogenase